jgi:hypothetical protein
VHRRRRRRADVSAAKADIAKRQAARRVRDRGDRRRGGGIRRERLALQLKGVVDDAVVARVDDPSKLISPLA